MAGANRRRKQGERKDSPDKTLLKGQRQRREEPVSKTKFPDKDNVHPVKPGSRGNYERDPVTPGRRGNSDRATERAKGVQSGLQKPINKASWSKDAKARSRDRGN